VKLLDVNWHEVFDLLPQWEALTIEQRRFLIDRSLAGYRARARDDKLIDLGWLEPVRKSKVVRYLVPQRRRFWLKLSASCRAPRPSAISSTRTRRVPPRRTGNRAGIRVP
jgi:hypothetical protein